MIQLRPAKTRGHAQHGWLESWHSFSFADYHDPAEMGWGVLRVINEDHVQPGMGFGAHGHRDMEIVSYVLEGSLEHRDNLGNGTIIRPGEVQRMSAGRGVIHSEFNPSQQDGLRFLQIWIRPAERGVEPSYEQIAVPTEERDDTLRLVASPDGAQGSVRLHQDARIYASRLAPGARLTHRFAPGRLGYVHLATGQAHVGGIALVGGDGLKLRDEAALELLGGEHTAELLLFDLPAA